MILEHYQSVRARVINKSFLENTRRGSGPDIKSHIDYNASMRLSRKRKASAVEKVLQIFLCHSHTDKPFVRKLARDLSSLGVDVWMDEWELEPGDSLHGCIGKALSSVAYVGVVLSPDSVSSRWCQSELDQALTREKSTSGKLVIPLLHRRVSAPPFLAGRLYVDFSRSYFTALTMLAGFLNRLPTREVAEALSHRSPKTLDAAVACLEAAGWKGTKYVEAIDFEKIRKIFKRSGVDLDSDQFDLVLRPKKHGARRKLPRRIPI